MALSALASVRPGESALALDCDFNEPTSADELFQTPLASAFGFSLTRLARHTYFLGRAASASFPSLMGDYYKAKRGLFGAGLSYSAICADPVFPLPPALGMPSEKSTPPLFPPPSAFDRFLQKTARDLGFRRALASHESIGITSFVYEAVRNSFEHGITNDPARKKRSTRAIIVEKIVLQNIQTPTTRFSPELNDYVERIREAHQDDLGLGILCLTVADQGDGIQATLPAKANETDQQRLARAFQPGESRKPHGIVSRGLGLPNIVSAAHHLRALVRITSRNLVVGQDFSLAASKYPAMDFQTVRSLPANCMCGTCISVFVPEYAFNVDQASLFGPR